MVELLLLGLGLRSMSPSIVQAADPVVGYWKAIPIGSSPERWWYWTLDIRADGTFRQHRDLRIMMNILGDGKGTWRREARGIRLTGEAEESFDDGYKKVTRRDPIDMLLVEKGGKLVEPSSAVDGKGGEPAGQFRRVKSLDRDPDPPGPPPDRKAEAIWALCRRTYRGMKRYRATGTTEHPGEKGRILRGRLTLSYAPSSGLEVRAKEGDGEARVIGTTKGSSVWFRQGSGAWQQDVPPRWRKWDRWTGFDEFESFTAMDLGIFADLFLTPSTQNQISTAHSGTRGRARWAEFAATIWRSTA